MIGSRIDSSLVMTTLMSLPSMNEIATRPARGTEILPLARTSPRPDSPFDALRSGAPWQGRGTSEVQPRP